MPASSSLGPTGSRARSASDDNKRRGLTTMRQRMFWKVAAALIALPPVGAQAASPVCTADASPAVTQGRLSAARTALREAVERGYAPGAILIVNRGGRPIINETIGLADRERRTPMRPDALFRFYSMTKPVTTVAAMQLVEAGKISLDDPVSKYIPGFASTPVYKSGTTLETLVTEPQSRPVTIRDLMRHTAGLTYKADGPTLVQRLYAVRGIDTGSGADIAPLDGSPRVASTAELADRLATIPLLNQPGTRFSYGNAVDVLGRVVEVASGERLKDYVSRHVLTPLKMRDTGFVIPEKDKPRLTAAYAARSKVPANASLLATIDPTSTTPEPMALIDDPTRSPYLMERPIDYGGAGLVGTASDYVRFAEAMRRGGELDGVRILKSSSVDAMRTNQLPAGARTPELADVGLGFGLGFAVRDGGSQQLSFPRCGYFWAGAASTYFWIDPVNDISGVLMTQVFGGDVRSVWLSIIDALYGETPKPAVSKK